MNYSDNELQVDFQALNGFVVHCRELNELEDLLGSFNLFEVLRSTNNELKHSNVLAWLFDPEESHGLGDMFLQRWMMRVLHENPPSNLAAAEIDGWRLEDVEIRREWNHIDILIILSMPGEKKWAVCIENKVNSIQSHNQLRKYRSIVENAFPSARKIFVFLTRHDEIPNDDIYLRATYEQIHDELDESVKRRSLSIGGEPRLLIDNYLRLLKEKFMNKTEIERLARAIYKNHKRAIDVITRCAQRNVIADLAANLTSLIKRNSSKLSITPRKSEGRFVRFTPHQWDQPGNSHGEVWGQKGPHIIVEIELTSIDSAPRFLIVIGKAPHSWRDNVLSISKEAGFPIIEGYKRHEEYTAPYSAFLDVDMAITTDEEDRVDSDLVAQRIFDAIEKELRSKHMQQAIDAISKLLPSLNAHFAPNQP